MSRKSLLQQVFLFMPCMFAAILLPAQHLTDSAYVHQFGRRNVVEAYTGEYGTRFDFVSNGNRKNNYKLVANTSGYVGIYLSYKWLSLKYSWAIPGTILDKNIKFYYTSLSFNLTAWHMPFHPFYHSYNGLLIPEKRVGRRMVYQPLHDIHISDAGTDIYYLTNSKKFRFNAASYFSQQQVKSAGSFLVTATPMWQRLALQNRQPQQRNNGNPLHAFIRSDKQWLSLTGRIGYNYNLVFGKGLWSISPAFTIGGGGLKELHSPQGKLRPVYDMQSWINAGYNGSRYYCYLNAQWKSQRANLLITNMRQTNTDVSLTGGLRFGNLRRKILGVL